MEREEGGEEEDRSGQQLVAKLHFFNCSCFLFVCTESEGLEFFFSSGCYREFYFAFVSLALGPTDRQAFLSTIPFQYTPSPQATSNFCVSFPNPLKIALDISFLILNARWTFGERANGFHPHKKIFSKINGRLRVLDLPYLFAEKCGIRVTRHYFSDGLSLLAKKFSFLFFLDIPKTTGRLLHKTLTDLAKKATGGDMQTTREVYITITTLDKDFFYSPNCRLLPFPPSLCSLPNRRRGIPPQRVRTGGLLFPNHCSPTPPLFPLITFFKKCSFRSPARGGA